MTQEKGFRLGNETLFIGDMVRVVSGNGRGRMSSIAVFEFKGRIKRGIYGFYNANGMSVLTPARIREWDISFEVVMRRGQVA